LQVQSKNSADCWTIGAEWRDLPPEAWAFLKAHKFFAMIIPKQYGGLGFSAYAHSEVIRKISTRSISAAVTAMVPNSLGPGELLMLFGTKVQQDYWLPRLAQAPGRFDKRRRVIASEIMASRDRRGVERRPVYIIDGSRTPFINARGKPGPFTPVDLAVQCGRPLLLRQPFAPFARSVASPCLTFCRATH
jgi:alkylation response protein AidB-like acyl-CoA dehydrogenase